MRTRKENDAPTAETIEDGASTETPDTQPAEAFTSDSTDDDDDAPTRRETGVLKFSVAECRTDKDDNITSIILLMNDGRMIDVKPDDALKLQKGDVLKSSDVTVSYDELNNDGTPKDPVVTAVTR